MATMTSRTDGGWAWFVTLAVFINVMFIDGTFATFGLIYPYLLDTFGSSPTVTSLAGSLVPAFLLLSTPVAACLIRRFDCRRVNFMGTCIASVSLILSSTCETIGTFAITYGIMAGVGIGFMSLSGHIMINIYFSKYRGLANGIVASGAGVGVFVISAFVQGLLEYYNWRETIFIYSACILHVCVSACLMRPLQSSLQEQIEISVEDIGKGLENTSTDRSETCEHSLLNPNVITNTNDDKYYQCLSVKGTRQKQDPSDMNLLNCGISMPELTFNKCESRPRYAENMYIHSQQTINGKRSSFTRTKLRKQGNCSCHINPLLRKDIFYSGSIWHLKEFKICGSIKDFVKSMEIPESLPDTAAGEEDETNQAMGRRQMRCVTSKFIDTSLLKYKVFIPMLFSAFLWQMGQFIPSTFLPHFCYSIGLSTADVTVVMGLFGGLNIFGRLSSGCLANLKAINSLWLSVFGSLMCSVACAMFPLFKTFSLVCIYSATFGYFIGYFVPLQLLLLVEYLGLDNLTSAMGIYQFVKGPGALFGPPLAGFVYQKTSDYVMTYLTAAVVFLLSAICLSFVPVVDKLSKKSEREIDIGTK